MSTDTPPPTSLRALLHSLWRRHSGRLGTTYALTALENIFDLLFPAAIGLAIDGLLAGRPERLAPMAALWATHLGVGLSRHIYDTKVFADIYTGLATETVGRQREAGVGHSQLAGRVALSREIVSFFEVEVPAAATATIRFVGAVAMLFFYDLIIGAFALMAAVPVALACRWFARRAYRLNAGLNDRLEREVEIVTGRPLPLVRRHFERLRFWRVAISNAEAATWGIVELAVIALTAAVLLRLTSTEGVTAGAIYAVLAYVWSFHEAVNDLPNVVQNVARVRDIGERVATEVAE